MSPSSLPLPFLFPRAFLGVRKEGRGSQQNKRRKGSFPPFLSSSSLTRCSPLIRLTTDRGCDERSCTHMLCRTVLRSTTTSPLNGEDEGILRATQTSLASPATKIRNIRMKQQEKKHPFTSYKTFLSAAEGRLTAFLGQLQVMRAFRAAPSEVVVGGSVVVLTAAQPPFPPPPSFLPLTPSHVSSWEGCRRGRRRLVVVQRGNGGREGGHFRRFLLLAAHTGGKELPRRFFVCVR